MALNLTIDQGNSSAKIGLWDAQGNLVESTTHIRFVARDVAKIAEGQAIDNAIYCTVSTRPPTMMKALQRRAGHVIEFGINTPLPIAVDYRTPHTLGLDRLAAAMGAFGLPGCQGRELLVVDIGTAITYDRVTSDDRYIGGNIAPGIYMRLKALNHYTARLPLVDPRGCAAPMWGNDTRSALLAGAVRGVVAEIEYYRNSLDADTQVVLTGGYADVVEPLLSFRPIMEHNLVSMGLLNILKYNRDINAHSLS